MLLYRDGRPGKKEREREAYTLMYAASVKTVHGVFYWFMAIVFGSSAQ